MTIFIFKGYAADVTEIKRLQYAAGEEEAKDAATRIVAAAVGNTAVGFSAKATLTGIFICGQILMQRAGKRGSDIE
jgi:hypothetical protein